MIISKDLEWAIGNAEVKYLEIACNYLTRHQFESEDDEHSPEWEEAAFDILTAVIKLKKGV